MGEPVATLHAELVVGALEVVRDRAHGEEQCRGDVGVRAAARRKRCDLQFAPSQRRRVTHQHEGRRRHASGCSGELVCPLCMPFGSTPVAGPTHNAGRVGGGLGAEHPGADRGEVLRHGGEAFGVLLTERDCVVALHLGEYAVDLGRGVLQTVDDVAGEPESHLIVEGGDLERVSALFGCERDGVVDEPPTVSELSVGDGAPPSGSQHVALHHSERPAGKLQRGGEQPVGGTIPNRHRRECSAGEAPALWSPLTDVAERSRTLREPAQRSARISEPRSTAEHQREPGVAFTGAVVDGLGVTERRGIRGLLERARFDEGETPRHEMDAGIGHRDLLPELEVDEQRAVGEGQRFIGATGDSEGGSTRDRADDQRARAVGPLDDHFGLLDGAGEVPVQEVVRCELTEQLVAPRAFGQLPDRVAQDGRCVLPPVEAPERDPGASERDERMLSIQRRERRGPLQRDLTFLGTTQSGEHFAEQMVRHHVGPVGSNGRASESLGQGVVVREPRVVRRINELGGFDGASRRERPHGNAHAVVPAASTRCADRLGQSAFDRHRPERRQCVPDHFPVHRMRESDFAATPVDVESDQAPRLEHLDVLDRAERRHDVESERLTQRDELERSARTGAEVLESGVDQLAQPRACAEGSDEPPDAVLVDQQVRLLGAEQQLSEQEWIAFARSPQLVGGGSVHVAAERDREQPFGVRAVERAHVDAESQFVLPQRRDRIGRGLTRTQGHDDEHLRVAREIVDDGR